MTGRPHPSNGGRPVRVEAIRCPWCSNRVLHPPGSPECVVTPGDLSQRLVAMGPLIAWTALNVTSVISFLNTILAAQEPPVAAEVAEGDIPVAEPVTPEPG